MRDVFILENMAACKDFMSDHIQKGYSEESFLGVGAFSSSQLNNANEGVKIKVTPNFLEQDLVDYIIQGYISVFEQDSILIQAQSNIVSISKWLILGQHTSIFSLSNREISKYLKSFSVSSMEEFVNAYFNFIISKINEMRAQIVVVLFDLDMFKNYVLKFFNWLDKEKKQAKMNDKLLFQENSLDILIIKELLHFLSNAFFNNKIAIIPSSPACYPIFLNTIHEIKKEFDLYAKDIIFRL